MGLDGRLAHKERCRDLCITVSLRDQPHSIFPLPSLCNGLYVIMLGKTAGSKELLAIHPAIFGGERVPSEGRVGSMSSGAQQLGRYHLLSLIARGGMGEIHLAEDPSINRQVAIKVIRTEIGSYAGGTDTTTSARLFQREARAIARLDHPHILPLYDYGEEHKDGMLLTYLVMPYRPEGSLANWLQQRSAAKPPLLGDIGYIIEQAASALQYTHDHQIIHQDVKPSNFLIRTNKENPNRPDVLVSDFGVARLSTLTSGSSQSIRGTPGYMAPEQWAGHPVPASDQYALAVMAYELLTGRSPFKGNPMQMMYAHVNTPPQAPSSINPGMPAALDAVILRGLAKRPEDRFPTISAFSSAFQQALQSSAAFALRAPNPYGSGAASTPGTASRPATPGSAHLYPVLAISEAEAYSGTSRVLTLPDGRKISVSIPPGIQNGQVIDLDDPNAATVKDSPGVLRLTISVLPAQREGGAATLSWNEQMPTEMATGDAATFINTPGRTGQHAVLADRNSSTSPPVQWQSATPYPTPVLQPPPVPASGREKKPSRNTVLVSVAVALLLILGSTGLLYASHSHSPGSNAGSPTASTQVNSDATATAQVKATATAQANTAATAQAQATATTQAQATATAVALHNINPYGGTLVMNDPLVDNSQGHQWREFNDTSIGNSCQFRDNAYHMVMVGNYGGTCIATATHFDNFAFQVQMTFFKYGQHFSGGGLVFRGNSATDQYYVLQIYESGQYSFYSCAGNDCSHGIAGYPAAALIPSFHLGLNQTNTIAVVANGNTFTFYANGQAFAGPIPDSTYTQGMIGLYAEGGSEGGPGATTDVAYSNAKVWQL